MGFGGPFFYLGVKGKDGSNILGPDWGQVWPSWALEATAMLLGAKLGDLEGKLVSGGHVEAKLGYVMMLKLYFRLCWAMLLVLRPEMLSLQQGQDFKWVSASYVCSIWGQVRLPYGCVGAILGPTSATLGLCWRLYRIILDHVASE